MSTRIKYCGLKSTGMVHVAAGQGAAFVGFVHHATSPRHLDFAGMQQLAAHVPAHIKHVAVLMKPEDGMIHALLAHYTPDYLQIHGADTERLAHIARTFRRPLIAAIGVRDVQDVKQAAGFEHLAEHVLFDAKQAGSGQAFDWQLLAGLQLKKDWFLAGGLTPENVAEAITTTRAPMVDVSSGIESAPGVKSAEKIAAFHRAVLEARA